MTDLDRVTMPKDASATPARRFRFTIRGLMIAIAAVAGLLALPSGLGIVAFVLSVPVLELFAARRLIQGGHRTFAVVAFSVTAAMINFLYVKACIEPELYQSIACTLGLAIAVPTIGCLGVAWLVSSSRSGALPKCWRGAGGIFVFLVTLLPLVTLFTFWPLHLNFWMVRTRLDALGDQVAAGKLIVWPQNVGPYRIRGSTFDALSGAVYLFTDPNPGGPMGFVRMPPKGLAKLRLYASPISAPPICGSDLEIDLGWGWSFREDD